jgi:hypothetical protein
MIDRMRTSVMSESISRWAALQCFARSRDGIELSDDPLPLVRAGAYGVSFARRSQEIVE